MASERNHLNVCLGSCWELRGGVGESRGQEAGEGGESASRTQLLLLRKDASAKCPEFSFLVLTQVGSSGPKKNSGCNLFDETGVHVAPQFPAPLCGLSKD